MECGIAGHEENEEEAGESHRQRRGTRCGTVRQPKHSPSSNAISISSIRENTTSASVALVSPLRRARRYQRTMPAATMPGANRL